MTPTIPRGTRQELRANLHRKTKSEPVTPDMALSIPEDEPCSPPAPEWRSTDLEEVQASTSLSVDVMSSPCIVIIRTQKHKHNHIITTTKDDRCVLWLW